MNKRISKKLAKMATVREFTVQEAWDKVAEFLAAKHPMHAPCYFIDKNSSYENYAGRLNLHPAGESPVLLTTKTWDEINGYVTPNVATEWPEWEHKLEPEEVTFYCDDCEKPITVQEDIGNEGICDDCRDGQSEMWAKEMKHEDYEYRNMKL